ncbi:hypothetical protein ACLEPN_19950 [Myxococcus sp. 1LA]
MYFESTTPGQQDIIWVYPKTWTEVTRHEPNPAYVQVNRRLHDVQLPADPGTIHPGWAGKQARFYQVTSRNECVLNRRQEMSFIQQFLRAKDVTVPGAQRTPICIFTFTLRNETPAMYEALRAAAATLIQHDFALEVTSATSAPLPWTSLHAELVSGGVQPGSARPTELAAFELGLIGATASLQQQSLAVKQSFLDAALEQLFGWDRVALEVALRQSAPTGQFDFPTTTQTIPL